MVLGMVECFWASYFRSCLLILWVMNWLNGQHIDPASPYCRPSHIQPQWPPSYSVYPPRVSYSSYPAASSSPQTPLKASSIVLMACSRTGSYTEITGREVRLLGPLFLYYTRWAARIGVVRASACQLKMLKSKKEIKISTCSLLVLQEHLLTRLLAIWLYFA